jgi:protoporphyrinogen/coproporphyrinogen III oxidase
VRRVAVVGAGLAGLTVALRRARAGDRVLVFEAERRLGGQLSTQRAGGFVVEHGAEGYVAGSAAVAALANEVGIAARVVEQLVHTSYGFDGQALVALGPGEAAQFLGFQVPARELGKGIRSFAGGMGELVDVLAAQLGDGVTVRSGVRVRGVVRQGGELRVLIDGTSEPVDHVVIATNAPGAADVLEAEFGAPAAALRDAALHSSVTVSCAFERAAVPHPLAGTGFVVAEAAQQEGLRACTFSSSKFPERAPAQRALLRLFFRPEETDLETLADAAWVARAERALERVLAVRSRAELAWVSRWPRALPVFDAAHTARVAALESTLAGSGVVLAGAGFHGSGIDAAVRSAAKAAEAIG